MTPPVSLPSGLRAGGDGAVLRRPGGPDIPGALLLRHGPDVQLHRLQRAPHLAQQEVGVLRGGSGVTHGAAPRPPPASVSPVRLFYCLSSGWPCRVIICPVRLAQVSCALPFLVFLMHQTMLTL